MNAWQTAEQQAQINYGRNQMQYEQNETVSQRPIGHKPRHLGGHAGYENRRPHFQHGGHTQHGYHQPIEQREQQGERERGHMAFLKALRRSQAQIRIVDILGAEVVGILKDCDETTISLRVPCEDNAEVYQNRVFIKQNIIEFAPVVDGVKFS